VKKVIGAALLGALCLLSGCGREDPKSGSSKPTPPGEKEWSEEEMATDPEGYLKWADAKLASQIKQREELLAGLSAKKKDIAGRRAKFSGDYEAIENLEKRLGTATRRASDEDRWPVTVAGKSFTKDEADSLLAQTKQFLADRKALASTYDDAVAKLEAGEKSLRDDIARITTLRDKVSVDLERVKVSRTNPELDKLRKTEAEIEHYSKILTPFADVNVQNLPKPTQPTAELQSMLK
jgi:DNA repair exonuclease SbcCD ATPase subunit